VRRTSRSVSFKNWWSRTAQNFEALYADRQKRARVDPHTGAVLVLSVDGKGVFVPPEDLREATQRTVAGELRLSRRGWGAVAACTPNGWARWPPVCTVEPRARMLEEILPASEGPEERPA